MALEWTEQLIHGGGVQPEQQLRQQQALYGVAAADAMCFATHSEVKQHFARIHFYWLVPPAPPAGFSGQMYRYLEP
jgi:hypothetical protein